MSEMQARSAAAMLSLSIAPRSTRDKEVNSLEPSPSWISRMISLRSSAAALRRSSSARRAKLSARARSRSAMRVSSVSLRSRSERTLRTKRADSSTPIASSRKLAP